MTYPYFIQGRSNLTTGSGSATANGYTYDYCGNSTMDMTAYAVLWLNGSAQDSATASGTSWGWWSDVHTRNLSGSGTWTWRVSAQHTGTIGPDVNTCYSGGELQGDRVVPIDTVDIQTMHSNQFGTRSDIKGMQYLGYFSLKQLPGLVGDWEANRLGASIGREVSKVLQKGDSVPAIYLDVKTGTATILIARPGQSDPIAITITRGTDLWPVKPTK